MRSFQTEVSLPVCSWTNEAENQEKPSPNNDDAEDDLMMALLVKMMMMVMMLNGDDEVDADGTDDGAVNDYIERQRERDKGTMDDYRIVVLEQKQSMELIHFVLYTHTYTIHDSNVGK